MLRVIKVRKATKIRNRLKSSITHDLTNKNKNQEINPFPAGDHKAAMDRLTGKSTNW